MFKTNDARVQQALQAIQHHVGAQEASYIDQQLLRPPGYVGTYGPLLSIGGVRGPFRSGDITRHRNAVRGLLLTGLVLGRLQPASVAVAKQEFLTLPLNEIARRMKGAFPFKPVSGDFSNLNSWDPRNFTTPGAGVMANYRFVVHSIMADPSLVGRLGHNATVTQEEWNSLLEQYRRSVRKIVVQTPGKGMTQKNLMVNFAKQYLENPSILRRNIISASVISDRKHPTYYPFGFILEVPKENIFSTSSRDQSVANRTNDVVGELTRVMTQKGGGRIATPDEVLQGTRQPNGVTGYNEVVVVGTSPQGTTVKAVGIFVKIDAGGRLYVRPGQNTPYVTPEVVELVRVCSSRFSIPIVKIVDTSSAHSDVAANF